VGNTCSAEAFHYGGGSSLWECPICHAAVTKENSYNGEVGDKEK